MAKRDILNYATEGAKRLTANNELYAHEITMIADTVGAPHTLSTLNAIGTAFDAGFEAGRRYQQNRSRRRSGSR